jgi:hypothetical protein
VDPPAPPAADRQQQGSTMKRLWRDYSLFWVMLLIFVVALTIEGVLEYRHMTTEYRWHGEALTRGTFWLSFVRILAGRIAASVLVLIIFTVSRAYFVYKGSSVSKDGPEERTALLKAIHDDIAELRNQR